MAALVGTVAQSLNLFTSGTVNNLSGVVANAAETIIYAVDYARGELQKITGIGTTLANTVLTSSLTAPRGIALSDDETTLYVLQENGVVQSVNATSGAVIQIGSMASLSTSWRYMKKGPDGYLYATSSDVTAVHRYSLASNTGELFMNLNYWTNGIEFSPDGAYLYFFMAQGGPNATNTLCRIVLAQGRYEIVAGTGAAANTDGENYLVAAFDQAGDIAVDSTGGIVYGGAGVGTPRLCVVTAGSTSRINVGGTGAVSGGVSMRFWMLRTANKLLCTGGSTFRVVI